MTNDQDHFFSINRLVDFGVSMAVAQQLVESMNYAMKNSVGPGQKNSSVGLDESNYYLSLDGKASGPYNHIEVSKLILDGKLTRKSYLWKPGMANWDLAENIPQILKLVALTPPPFQPLGVEK